MFSKCHSLFKQTIQFLCCFTVTVLERGNKTTVVNFNREVNT